MRRHDRNLFLPDRHLRQQPRIGLGKTGQIIGLIDRQRTPDETLLVDDLRLTQLFLGPDDVIHRIQLVLQLDLLGVQGLDLLAPHGHLLGQGLHLDAHLGEILPQPGNFVFLLGKLRAHVPNHLLQSVETQIGFAQLRDSALQRSDLDFVFPQQPVDGGNIVVDLLHGAASSLSLAGGEVAERAKVPVLATSSTNPLVTQGKKYYFRACFIDPYQGAAAATYAYKDLGFKKAAVLTDVVSDYAVGLSNFFKKTFKKIGGELVADMKYSSGDQDFTAQLTELISKKPDIVFMPAYFAEGAIIMKQARELGATFVLMGGDAMDNPDTLKIGGKAVEGFLHTTFPYDVNMENMSAEAKTFTDAWKKNFPNKDPNVNSALGYNCYNIILDALTRAGKADTEALTAALAATKNLPTALGVLSINETHDAEMPVGIIKYMDGKRKYIGDAIAE